MQALKKALVYSSVLAVGFCIGTANSSRADDQSSGCGLGWQVSKKNSIVSSFIREITNSMASNTIAMTSGTSGCAKHDIVKRDSRPIHFTEANYNNLALEMAQGSGETLASYAVVLGCDASAISAFSKATQQGYTDIFTSENVKPNQVLENVQKVLRSSPSLSKSCAGV